MISEKELLSGQCELKDLSPELQANFAILLERINKVRAAWNKPMRVTSGVRTMEHHLQVYKDLAKQRGVAYDESQVPKLSKHLFAQAVDIYDKDGSLFQWCKDNEKLLEEIGLWMEEADDQPRVHFQIVPPRSGRRFFKP